jgi:hypothetical protein
MKTCSRQVPRLHEGPRDVCDPVLHGPAGFPAGQDRRRITDSAYVVVNMRIMTHMGAHVLRRLEDEASGIMVKKRDGHGRFIPCLHSSAPRSSPARPILLALQRRQIHLPLPRDPRDLVLRLRLRRQRPARQEVPGPAHRLDHRPRTRLDGRAHAAARHPRSRRREDLRGRRLPVRLRQDQPRHDRAARKVPQGRLEDHHRRRRHRLALAA